MERSSDGGSGGGDAGVTRLDTQAGRGFLATHDRLSENHANLFQLASTVYALLDLFLQKGLLTLDEVQAQAAVVAGRLGASEFGKGMRLALASDSTDKYREEGVVVDCESRLAACRAACCALDVPLSPQDVSEGVARWDFGRPYLLRREPGGHCSHLDGDRRCTIREQRPRSCRLYSCAGDARIWQDFERRIPNTEGIDALLGRPHNPIFAGGDPAFTAAARAASLKPAGEG